MKGLIGAAVMGIALMMPVLAPAPVVVPVAASSRLSPATVWQHETPRPYGQYGTNEGWTLALPGTHYACGWETIGVVGPFCADDDLYLPIITNAQTALVVVDGITYVWHQDGTHTSVTVPN